RRLEANCGNRRPHGTRGRAPADPAERAGVRRTSPRGRCAGGRRCEPGDEQTAHGLDLAAIVVRPRDDDGDGGGDCWCRRRRVPRTGAARGAGGADGGVTTRVAGSFRAVSLSTVDSQNDRSCVARTEPAWYAFQYAASAGGPDA